MGIIIAYTQYRSFSASLFQPLSYCFHRVWDRGLPPSSSSEINVSSSLVDVAPSQDASLSLSSSTTSPSALTESSHASSAFINTLFPSFSTVLMDNTYYLILCLRKASDFVYYIVKVLSGVGFIDELINFTVSISGFY